MKSFTNLLDFFKICELKLWKKIGNFTWQYVDSQVKHRIAFYETGSIIYENDNKKFELIYSPGVKYDQQQFILDLQKFSINIEKVEFLKENIFGLTEILDLERTHHSFRLDPSYTQGDYGYYEDDDPFYSKLQKIHKIITDNAKYVFSVQTIEYNTGHLRTKEQKLKTVQSVSFDLSNISNHALLEKHILCRKKLESIESLKNIL